MSNQRTLNPITASIDLLFTLLIFWAFLQWDNSATIASKALLCFLYLIIINDWFSCRATYEFYTSEMFIIDVVIIFLFLRMITALTTPHLILGYQSVFWIELGILSAMYGIWDYIVSVYTKNFDRRKGLQSWGNKMFCEGLICTISYFAIEWLKAWVESRFPMILLAELPPTLVFLSLIILWNKEKFQLYKELEKTFKNKGKSNRNNNG